MAGIGIEICEKCSQQSDPVACAMCTPDDRDNLLKRVEESNGFSLLAAVAGYSVESMIVDEFSDLVFGDDDDWF